MADRSKKSTLSINGRNSTKLHTPYSGLPLAIALGCQGAKDVKVEISPFEELGRAVVSSLVSFLGSILVLFNTKKQNLLDYV